MSIFSPIAATRYVQLWRWIFPLFLVLLHLDGLSQNIELLPAKRLTTQEGLSSLIIRYVASDTAGFMWLLHSDGLDRYDGQVITNYQLVDYPFRSTEYHSLFVDANNLVWLVYRGPTINSKEGIIFQDYVIDILDPHRDSVFSFDQYFSNEIEVRESEISWWGYSPDRQVHLSMKSGHYYLYRSNLSRVTDQPFDEPARLVSFTDSTFLRLKDRSLQEIDRSHNVLKSEVFSQRIAQFLLLDKGGVWLKTTDPRRTDPTGELDHRTGNFFIEPGKPIKKILLPSKLFPNPFRVDFKVDSQQRVWIYNNNTMAVMTKDTIKKVLSFDNNLQNPDLFFDRQNNVWIRFTDHLAQFIVRENTFENVLSNEQISIRAIHPLPEDRLFINSYSGRFVLDFFLTPRQFDTDFRGMGMATDRDGIVWSGAHGNHLHRLFPFKQAHTFRLSSAEFPNPTWMDIRIPHIDQKNQLWLGTSVGLFSFDKSNHQFVQYPSELPTSQLHKERILGFHENGEGLWILARNGLYLKKNDTGGIEYFEEGPKGPLVHMYEDPDGVFWIASKRGLIKWDRNSNLIRQFTMEDGFSNNVIHAVYPDDFGRLWLPSNHGLICFDSQTEVVTNFFKRDGISHDEFNYLAHYQDEKGRLYLGTIDGLTTFHPKDLQSRLNDSSLKSWLQLTEVTTENIKNGLIQNKTSEVLNSERIILPAGTSSFTAHFAVVDFISTAHSVQYRLEGWQNEWQTTTERLIRFHKLPYGQYTLTIRSRGENGRWAKNELIFPVLVQSPFYVKPWFIVMCVLTIALIVFGAFRWRMNQLQKQKAELAKEVQRQTQRIEEDKVRLEEAYDELQNLNRLKDKIFAIVGHELRGPILQFRNIGKKVSFLLVNERYEQVDKVSKQIDQTSLHIENMLNNLLNWGLVDSKRIKIRPQPVHVQEYLSDLLTNYRGLAEAKGIDFKSRLSQSFVLFCDPNSIYVIMHNLLSNAVKFCSENDTIRVSSKIVGKKWGEITIADSGPGIPEPKLTSLFAGPVDSEKGSQGERGTGLGIYICQELMHRNNGTIEVKSILGEGTTFVLKLLLHPTKEHEIVTDNRNEEEVHT